MTSLVAYAAGSSSEGSEDEGNSLDGGQATVTLSKGMVVKPAPHVDESLVIDFKMKNEFNRIVDPQAKELSYNVKFEDLYAAEIGPANPNTVNQMKGKNFLTGHLEEAHVNEYQFENQRKIFHCYGIANNPSDGSTVDSKIAKGIPSSEVGATSTAADPEAEPPVNPMGKRRRERNMDPADIDGYTGPWAQYTDEVKVSQPNEEEQEVIDQYMSKKKKYTMKKDKEEVEEKSTLHIKDPYDYQGRSFLHAPQDLDVNLRDDFVPQKCFLPKRCIHTYTGHTKALTAIRWFPKSAHLFLSAGMDGKVKLWEVYNQRRCILTFLGHKQAVRDICFNRNGDRFVSAGYDRSLKMWDTETGQCIKRFNCRKVAYCIKFNPDAERSHLFLTGMSDKKILCWDSRSGSIVQEYDRHLGPVNTITFVDNNRRFVSTSDDKSLRVWEWDIPVDIKYIADPGMHAIPAVTQAPSGKWLACQMMDNKIQAFACMNRFKLNSKKVFTGHMVAGYACSPDFSPDMSYLTSGDADGKVFIWNWKTTKLVTNFQAHENVCISTLWHPHETSKLLTAGWDNHVKLWD
ncbi:Pre-mRNA-processing factor 17 [Halotydeus destructor]|nr:Pre-mRNA-processing factor 17 [Halotydeus destructor]